MAKYDNVKFRVIVADPPWPYPETGVLGTFGHGKGTQHVSDGWFKDGKVLSIPKLCSVTLPRMDGSCLFLWCTSGNLPSALVVMGAWGFNYRACFVWARTTKNRTMPTSNWNGYWSRVKHQMVLFGITDNRFFKRDHNKPSIDSVWFIPHLGGHGTKPDIVCDMIQREYAGPYLELFAVKRRPGWFAYGDQLDGGSDISIPEWDDVH